MMKLSVVPGDVIPGVSFVDAMSVAKQAGIDAVELHEWWQEDLRTVRSACQELSVRIVTVCAPFSDIADRSVHRAYLDGMAETIEAARRLGAGIVIVTTGAAQGADRDAQHGAIVDCMQACVPLAEKAEITLAIEPLNITDGAEGCASGYYLWSSDEAFLICDEVASDRMTVLFDIYHQQVSEGNVTQRICSRLNQISHMHAAGVPGRNELDVGELNYAYLFSKIGLSGYNGHIGLEYNPSTDSLSGMQTAVSYIDGISQS